jgi:hypothetical protein
MNSPCAPASCSTLIEDSQPLRSVLWWYAGGAVAAVAIGYFAARFNLWGIAPVGLLSIAVGGVLGGALGGLAAFTGMWCRTRLILGTMLLAMMTVLAEHAWLYRDFRRQWHEARSNSAEVALFRPETPWSPVEYFTLEASNGRVLLWALDAVIVTVAAIATIFIVVRYMAKTRVASDAAKWVGPTPDT